jgi:hypothetical protein
VGSAGGGDTWGEFSIGIRDQNGTSLPTTAAGWGLIVEDANRTVLASYNITAAPPAWSSGGGVMLSTLQTMDLTAPETPSLGGDMFTLMGTGLPCSGSTSVTLP